MKRSFTFQCLILSIVLITISCQKPERDNYWDSKAKLNPDVWAPLNLSVSINNTASVTLNWEQNVPVEGFFIDRQATGEDYRLIASLDANARQFTDTTTSLPGAFSYRIAAYAGENVSSYAVKKIAAPNVNTIEITNITATKATIGNIVSSDWGLEVNTRGVVWDTLPNPTVSNNLGMTYNGNGLGSWTVELNDLIPNKTYYVRAYATNEAITMYGDQLSFTTQNGLPEVTTVNILAITNVSASCTGNVNSDGGFPITARGTVWSNTENPSLENNLGITADGAGLGSFTSELTTLAPNTIYYIRTYATNAMVTAYGQQLSFSTLNNGEVMNASTGKIWMDRNLGASRIAVSSNDAQAYGDLYQWGRAKDGHEKRNSLSISVLSNSDQPGHGNFITTDNSPRDWRSPQNDNLWQGESGINNPCPSGYRLPTKAEWDAERLSWSSNNAAGAFASPLKLTVAGYRNASLLGDVGSSGCYWSANVDATRAWFLNFSGNSATMNSFYRVYGFSVRCIKD